MAIAPTLKLNDGHEIPQIGLGTWPMDDAEVASVIPTAVELGYRHFDTAVNYGNETGVGEGIRRSGIARDEVFITTKVPGRAHGYESAKASLDESLTRIQTDYVDLYLIHWPNPNDDKYVETWQALVDLQKDGKARSIGVSNFKPSHLERLQSEVGVAPAVNQIQLYPAVSQDEMRAYDEQHGTVTESWSPLGLGANTVFYGGQQTFLETPILVELAKKYGRTPAQIVLRWHVELGLVPLPKSSNPERLAQNIDVFDFQLAPEDVAAVTAMSDGPAPADSDEHHEY